MESDMEDIVYCQSRNEPVEPQIDSDSSISELSSEPSDLDQYMMSSVFSSQQPLRTISVRSGPRRRRVAPDQKLDEAIRAKLRARTSPEFYTRKLRNPA